MAKKITVEEITKKLDAHVEEMFTSEGFKRWLKTLSAFPSYSLKNTLLISMQMPNATKVCGYKQWQELGRQVKLGQGVTGIRIYAPFKKKKWVDEKDKDGNPVLDDNGKPKKVKKEWTYFDLVSVFDISQTDGDPLPDDPCKILDDELDGFDNLYFALTDICPVTVDSQPLSGDSKGYYDKKRNIIKISSNISEAQATSTLLNAMAHEMLLREDSPFDKETVDIQAEAIAYTVCQHYDFDTSDFTFGYIATWAAGKNKDEREAAMEPVVNAAGTLIKKIDRALGIKDALAAA